VRTILGKDGVDSMKRTPGEDGWMEIDKE